MYLSVFFDENGIFNTREKTVLRRIDERYKEAYLDYRMTRWDILKKDKKIADSIRDDLWSYVDVDESSTLYLAITNEQDVLIGYATIGKNETEYPELGLELKDEHQGQGHGKDTIDMLLETGAQVLGKKKFLVRVDSDNYASLALIEKYNIQECGREQSTYLQALEILNEGKAEEEKTKAPDEIYKRECGRCVKKFLLLV